MNTPLNNENQQPAVNKVSGNLHRILIESLQTTVIAAFLIGGLANGFASTLALTSDSASPYINTGVGFPPSITLPIDGGDGVNNVGGADLQSANPGSQLGNAVFVFQLPSLGAVADPFSSASFTVTLASTSGDSAYGFNSFSNNYDLYGLGVRASATVLASDFFAGNGDNTDASLLQAKIAGTFASNQGLSPAAGTAFTIGSISDLSVLNYLNAQYASGAGAGQYVFLRINPNYNAGSFTNQSWAADSTTFVTYTAVPEPSTWVCIFVGGLLAVAVRARKLIQ